MKYLDAKNYLLSKPEAMEDYPFGPDTAVFKVRAKMFATLVERQGNQSNNVFAPFTRNGKIAIMNLKCDPDEAFALRDLFKAVIPGYHMNKKYWNSVILDNSIPEGEIKRMIDNSFALVVLGMPKKKGLGLLS